MKLDRLGDFVLALSAIRLLVRRHGEENCLLVISPVAEPLAAREFPRVRRIAMPASLGHARMMRAALQYRRTLRRCAADTVVCLRHQRWDYDELVMSWIPARRWLRIDDGFTRQVGGQWRTFEFRGPSVVAWDRELHFPTRTPAGRGLCRELMMNRTLAEAVLGTAVTADAIIPAIETAPRQPHGAIVVSPFGSEAIKNFPRSLLAPALHQARARLGSAPVVLMGTPSQRLDLGELAMQLSAADVPDVSYRTDLQFDEYLTHVAGAPLVISTDTATAHVAAACDRPALIVIGGGHYGQFGPWWRSQRQQWLTKSMDCFGCNWVCRHPEPFCLTQIPADEVARAIQASLSAAAPS